MYSQRRFYCKIIQRLEIFLHYFNVTPENLNPVGLLWKLVQSIYDNSASFINKYSEKAPL